MIDGHSYLTRMNTFISPGEMDEDALFFANSGLGDVPLLHTATLRTMCGDKKFMACNAPVRLELADGRMAWVRSGSTSTTCSYRPVDLTGLAKLPAAEMAWMRDAVGPGTVTLDNTKAIEDGLAAYNSAFPAEQNMFPSPTSGGGGMLTSSGGGGCSCGVGGGVAGGAGGGAAGLLVGLFAARRRRSRR
jgi:MYXO-CTERM domain-containing protein